MKKCLKTSDHLMGYRAVWKSLRDRYGIIIRRDTVMTIMRSLDPSGVADRRRRRLRRRTYSVPVYSVFHCMHAYSYHIV